MSFALENKKIIVTGASGTIGEAIAKYLDEAGANLVISGTNEEKLQNLRSQLKRDAHVITQNLSDLGSVHTLIDKAKDALGGLDGLVCNAGVTDDKLAIRMNLDSWQRVIDVNLTSSFILNKHACMTMMRQKYGRIVNVTSIVGISGNVGQTNYCAAKAGLIGMSKSLAKEFASKNVLVNCIAPGFVRSNMTDKLTEEQKDIILQEIPQKRIGQASELVGVVALLLSDLSSYITGQTFHINGGMLMV